MSRHYLLHQDQDVTTKFKLKNVAEKYFVNFTITELSRENIKHVNSLLISQIHTNRFYALKLHISNKTDIKSI